jgi:hypothetical protein
MNNYVTITEYYAAGKPRVRQARKYEISGPQDVSHDDLDMRNAKELIISYVKPRKRNSDYLDQVRILHGTARNWKGDVLGYNDDHYVVITADFNGAVLFDSRNIFPCDMEEFAKKRADYVAEMAKRGFNIDASTFA